MTTHLSKDTPDGDETRETSSKAASDQNASTSEMLNAALAYARQGIRVLPLYGVSNDGVCLCWKHEGCSDSGKHPMTKNGLSDATTSEPMIRRWWKQWPDANVGGRMGSKMVALDPDSAEGLAEAIGYGVDVDAPHSTSRPGHRHYFFKPPVGMVLQNQVKKTGHWPFQYCDARGEGGYVVLPPSRHFTGTRYTWSEPLNLETLPEPPAALLEAWKTHADDPRSGETVWDETDGAWVEVVEEATEDAGEGFETARYFTWRYTQAARAGDHRNPTGFMLALQLRDAPLRYDAAVPFMRQYQVSVETLRPHKPNYDWKQAEQSLKQAYSRPRRAAVTAQSTTTAGVPARSQQTKFDWRSVQVNASTLQTMAIIHRPYVVPHYIPHGLTLLGGRPKAGKTTFSMATGFQSAKDGGAVMGEQLLLSGDVHYIGLEDTLERYQRRFEQMFPNEEWPERLHLYTEWPTMGQGGLEALDELLDAYPDTVLTVLDSWPLFRGVAESAGYNKDYMDMHRLAELVRKRDANVLAITHTTKTRSQLDGEEIDFIQDTTGITAGADTVLVMKRIDGIMTLFRRGRDLEDNAPVKLADDPEQLLWVPTTATNAPVGRSTRLDVLCCLARLNGAVKPSVVAADTGLDRNNVKVMLHRLAAEQPPLVVGNARGEYTLTMDGTAVLGTWKAV